MYQIVKVIALNQRTQAVDRANVEIVLVDFDHVMIGVSMPRLRRSYLIVHNNNN